MMLLRDYGTMSLAEVLGAGDRLRAERPSAARTRQRHHRHGRGACSASIGRPRPRSICRTIKVPAAGSLFANKTLAATYSRIVKEAESAGGDRVAQIERARKAWSHGFVAEAIDRFCRTQEIMDTSGAAASRRAHRRRHGALDAAYRSAADLRLRPLHGVQDRPVGPGPGDVAATRAAQGFRFRRARSDRAGFHPPHRRMLEARLCRPRSVLRRSRFRRSADGDAVVGCLQFRAPQARHRQGLARVAPRLDRRFRRGGETAPRSRTDRGRRRRATTGSSAPASRPSAGSARCAATPCISTSSIRPATWCRRRRRAAGCIPRRSSPSSASASAPARRCSGSKRAIRRRSRPASGRAPRCRRRSRCATASPISPGARPAATARISGSRSSSCATSMPA